MLAFGALPLIVLLGGPGTSGSPAGIQPPGVDAALQRYMSLVEDLGFSGSVLVCRGEQTVFERWAGMADRTNRVPITADTLFDTGAVACTFTAVALLRLAQDGSLKLADHLSAHLSDVPLHARPVTVEHLLRHTSGLHFKADLEGVDLDDSPSVAAAILADTPISPAGLHYREDGMGYTLGAMIAERVSRKDLPELLAEKVFKPAGMTATRCAQSDAIPDGAAAHGYERGRDYGPCSMFPFNYVARGNSGVLSTPRDLARWTRAVWSGDLLSPQNRKTMFTPTRSGFGLGWFVQTLSGAPAGALGPVRVHHEGSGRGFDASVTFWPEAASGHTSAVVLSNDRYWLPTVAREIESIVAGDSPLPAVGAIPVDAIGVFAGEFVSDTGERMIVTVDSRNRSGVGAALRLIPMSQEAFDRIYLGGPHDPARTTDGKRLWPRAEALVKEHVFLGTADAINGGFYGGEENPHAAEFYSDWSTLVKELGQPTGVESLYSGLRALVDRTLVTRVLVNFPKGRRVLTITWTGKVEKAVAIDVSAVSSAAAVTFEPDSKAAAGAGTVEFYSFRPQGISPPRVLFRRLTGAAGYDVLDLLDSEGKPALTLRRKQE